MWTLTYYYSLDPQGGPTHSKVHTGFTFSTDLPGDKVWPPEPPPSRGHAPLLPGVGLLTLAWLRQGEVPGLAG